MQDINKGELILVEEQSETWEICFEVRATFLTFSSSPQWRIFTMHDLARSLNATSSLKNSQTCESLTCFCKNQIDELFSSLRGHNLQLLEIQWRTTSDEDSYYKQNSHYKDSYSIDIEVSGSSLWEKTRDLKFYGSRKTIRTTLLKIWKLIANKLLFEKLIFLLFQNFPKTCQKTCYKTL